MALTTTSLRHAIDGIGARLETGHEQLTALDAQLGDGDLGVTLLKGFRALADIKAALPDDLGLALLASASAVSKVSSSSFGTLMATALMAVAKDSKGKTSIEWTETARLVTLGREAMQARGKANLGDKTVLDSLAAIEIAVAGTSDPAAQIAASRKAAAAALAAFRDKPNKIGRARVYAERSVGLDDPGMAAIVVMLEGL
jgi:dihydroxyacetone kinase-like protein